MSKKSVAIIATAILGGIALTLQIMIVSAMLSGLGLAIQITKPALAQSVELVAATGPRQSPANVVMTPDQHMESDSMDLGLNPNEAGTEQHEEGEHEHSGIFGSIALWAGFLTLMVSPSPLIKINKLKLLGISKYMVGVLSIGAGAMHVLLMPDHLNESLGYGIFFITSGVAQIVFGSLFMARPMKKLAIAGLIGNSAMIILYLVTRTTALPSPFLGIEEVDLVGIIAKIVEVSLVAVLSFSLLSFAKMKRAKVVQEIR